MLEVGLRHTWKLANDMRTNKNYHEFLILGAGVAGLGAGVTLKKENRDSLILEKDPAVGGLNRNSTLHGCDFGFGPKILLLDNSENSKDILSFLGDNYEKYPVVERTYLSEYGLLGFPLQRFLIDLPETEKTKIISDLNRAQDSPRKLKSFKDWLINGFGEYFCNLALFPYEEKKWQIDLSKMDYTWALDRPIKVNYEEIIEGSKVRLAPNKYYYYPRTGNISVLPDAMSKAAGSISTETKVLGINLKDKSIKTNQGIFYFDHLISSLPLDYIVQITNDLPQEIRKESKEKLKRLSILVYNLVFDGRHELDGTAIYFPEKKFVFRRVSILQNLCPALGRKNLTPISIELSINHKSISQAEAKDILEKILANFKEIDGLNGLGKPIDWEMLRVDFAYPPQLNGLSKIVKEIQAHYESFEIYHCGRGGNFDYCNSDQAYKQGKEVALAVLQKTV